MCVVGQPCPAGWAEPLPIGCPPARASNTDGERLYRLVKSDPPTTEDFQSHRQLGYPSGNACECTARAISLWASLERSQKMRLLSRFKTHKIARMTLSRGAGALLPGRHSHLAWWPCAAYDPLANATVVD
jgi:hypothetical protein